MNISSAPVQNLIVNANPLDPLTVGKSLETLVELIEEQDLMVDALDGIKREIVIESVYWVWGDGEAVAWADDEEVEQ